MENELFKVNTGTQVKPAKILAFISPQTPKVLGLSDDKNLWVGVDVAAVAEAMQLDEKVMSVCDAVHSITNLALLNRKFLHINVAYSPECADLDVKVFHANTNYFGRYHSIFSRSVHLDQPSSLLQLQTLEDELLDLVADAKDKLMGAV